MEIVFSGIQPTGRLHLGNYLGAVKQWLALQEQHPCYFCIVDLHAITTNYNPSQFPQQVLETAAEYLALDLNPKQSTLFVQSHVPEHAELAWLLGTLVPIAELGRMTQYKDKAREHVQNINAGLLTYPVLMAADVLLYRSTQVPVGEDQAQHLELARLVARKFNGRFGAFFPEPKTIMSRAARIKSLADPVKKMSKSAGERHYVAIDDEPAIIRKKVLSAVTDTGADAKTMSPGVENLFLLLREFAPLETFQQFEQAHAEGTIRYQELKETLSDAITNHFADFRKKKKALLAKPNAIRKILDEGAQKARRVAGATLKSVRQRMGLL